MAGKTIAIYSLKGGVGKTTLAVNLGWATAAIVTRQTLLWDLDGQAAASYILGEDAGAGQGQAKGQGGKGKKVQAAAIRRELDAKKLIVPTGFDRLKLLPADASLHGLDIELHELDKKKRLAKIAADLAGDYDRVIIDCPPGLTDTSEQILRAADLVVVPVIPSPLAQRAFAAIKAHLVDNKALRVPLLPVFSMVDRRRALHRAALAEAPDWPVIPMSSVYERMTEARKPVGAIAPKSNAAVKAVSDLGWAIEVQLSRKGAERGVAP